MAIGLNQYLVVFGLSAKALLREGRVLVPEATTLEVAETGKDGREHLLLPDAARNWQLMQQAAALDGVNIYLISGYRSISHQANILEGKLEAGTSLTEILKSFAPPGFSEHHSGRAVDVATANDPEFKGQFEKTTAFRWLQRHAEQYGYRLSYPPDNAHGYKYEPWHWYYFPS